MAVLAVKAGVSWQDAENALEAAVEYLQALPDRERAFLSAGSRCCWPEVVRSRADGDYGEGQGALGPGGEQLADAPAPPSPALTRRRMALVEAMVLGDKAAVLAVPVHWRGFLGRVLLLRWRAKRGAAVDCSWAEVWRREKALLARQGLRIEVTSDALRARYDRAVGKVAAAMEAQGVMVGEG